MHKWNHHKKSSIPQRDERPGVWELLGPQKPQPLCVLWVLLSVVYYKYDEHS